MSETRNSRDDLEKQFDAEWEEKPVMLFWRTDLCTQSTKRPLIN